MRKSIVIATILVLAATFCRARGIESGESLPGSIPIAGAQEVFTFSAVAGDTAQIRMGLVDGSTHPTFDLRDPVGSNVVTASGYDTAEATVTIKRGGTYTIICKDDSNGTLTYGLSIIRMTGYPLSENDPDIGPVVSGPAYTGAVSRAGDLDAATFSAAVGDTVQIRMGLVDGSTHPTFDLRDPVGSNVVTASGYDTAEATVTIRRSGMYTIICKDDSNGTLTYGLSMIRITGHPLSGNDPDIGPIRGDISAFHRQLPIAQALVGALFGLLPLLMARRGNRTTLGVVGMIVCIVLGGLLGKTVAGIAAVVFAVLVLLMGRATQSRSDAKTSS